MEELDERTTRDRFHLTLKVETRKMSYRDHQSRGKEWNETAEVVVLVPLQTTEADYFYRAWLPEKFSEEEREKLGLGDLKDYSEIVLEMGTPICGYFRGALRHGNQLYPQPHIFVMTKLAEEKLRPYVGKSFEATVIGDEEEEQLYGDLRPETRSPYAGMK